MAVFRQVQRLAETRDHLTAADPGIGFMFDGERVPLVNPQRGIFNPQRIRHLLSIKTVFPKPGAKVWYDDQRQVHRQIYEGEETIDYAFMGTDQESRISWRELAAVSATSGWHCPVSKITLKQALNSARLAIARPRQYRQEPFDHQGWRESDSAREQEVREVVWGCASTCASIRSDKRERSA